jgi:hypothetical protein
MTEKRLFIVNILALVCAVWFLLLGWMWVYFFNVILVFPFAIIGFFLWRKGRAAEKKLLNKVTGWMLLSGLVSSVGVLVVLLLFN